MRSLCAQMSMRTEKQMTYQEKIDNSNYLLLENHRKSCSRCLIAMQGSVYVNRIRAYRDPDKTWCKLTFNTAYSPQPGVS